VYEVMNAGVVLVCKSHELIFLICRSVLLMLIPMCSLCAVLLLDTVRQIYVLYSWMYRE